MKTYLITQLVKLIIGLLNADLLRQFVDTLLDFIEEFVEGTKSDIDDAIILPVCEALRSILNIPDDD